MVPAVSVCFTDSANSVRSVTTPPPSSPRSTCPGEMNRYRVSSSSPRPRMVAFTGAGTSVRKIEDPQFEFNRLRRVTRARLEEPPVDRVRLASGPDPHDGHPICLRAARVARGPEHILILGGV